MAKLLRQALCIMDSDKHDAHESEFDELCDRFEAPHMADAMAGDPILAVLEADDRCDDSEELSTTVLAFGLHLSARCRPSVDIDYGTCLRSPSVSSLQTKRGISRPTSGAPCVDDGRDCVRGVVPLQEI